MTIKKLIGTARDPGKNAFLVTPDDNTDLTVGRALWVGTGGNLNIQFANDDAPVLVSNVPGGVLLPFEVIRVYSTSTTASDIVVIY